ncbi:MAG: PQQ-dependent sugar dehydrogenase [Rhodobacteraceae bacterium]|nr:PQQ-dependent sugar dehydrogenase [Paracoccaceae bacterium]
MIIVSILVAFGVPAAALDTQAGQVDVIRVIGGLDQPWGMGFLPGGGILVTERGGRLLHVADGKAQTVSGTPDVVAEGQGGLLDVMVPRDFAQSREVFLSYSKDLSGGAGTALARGVLSPDGARLTNVTDIFVMSAGSGGGRHFGSRVVEATDGTIFLTIGDRGDRPSAQDRSRHNGSVIRVNRDGSVPSDNPFVGQTGVLPEIWSFGHRNPQGAALDLEGQLWVNEHGAQGGDEVNRVQPGANYGWPVISYGRHYSGRKIGEGTEKAGMEQPAHYWDPSIAPSGMMIYSGKLWQEWRGDMFIGSLKFGFLSRVDGTSLTEVERIEGDETARVRDVREAPDGSIWFMSVGNDAIYRMTPG